MSESTEKALAKVGGSVAVSRDHEQISPLELGKIFCESGYFPDIRSAAQGAVKVMFGRELGIPAITSCQSIHLVKGKMTFHYALIGARIRQSGRYRYEVKESTKEICRIEFYDGEKLLGESKFDLQDAREWGTQNMDRFPKVMLFARAMSQGAKMFTPDIFGGLPIYVEGELDNDVLQNPEPQMGTGTTEKLQKMLLPQGSPEPTITAPEIVQVPVEGISEPLLEPEYVREELESLGVPQVGNGAILITGEYNAKEFLGETRPANITESEKKPSDVAPAGPQLGADLTVATDYLKRLECTPKQIKDILGRYRLESILEGMEHLIDTRTALETYLRGKQ